MRRWSDASARFIPTKARRSCSRSLALRPQSADVEKESTGFRQMAAKVRGGAREYTGIAPTSSLTGGSSRLMMRAASCRSGDSRFLSGEIELVWNPIRGYRETKRTDNSPYIEPQSDLKCRRMRIATMVFILGVAILLGAAAPKQDGWKKIENRSFSFSVPSAFKKTESRGI